MLRPEILIGGNPRKISKSWGHIFAEYEKTLTQQEKYTN